MSLRLKAITFSAVVFLILTMASGSVHQGLFEILPQEGLLGTMTEGLLLVVSLLPAIISGFIAGYMSRAQGIVIGAISVSIAAITLFGVLGAGNWSQQLVAIILGGLAGGCGELFAVKHAA